MSNVVKFPFSVSRKAHARKPRAMAPTEVILDNQPSAGSLSITAENGRLRQERYEVWRMAEAATRYWRVRLDFHEAVSWAQRMEIPEGRSHLAVNPDDRMPMVEKYRAALVKQLLTPAPNVAAVNWKQAALKVRLNRHYRSESPLAIHSANASPLVQAGGFCSPFEQIGQERVIYHAQKQAN